MRTFAAVAGEMLKAMARIDIVHVPYKGNAAALNDLIGGRVHLFFSNLVTAMPHARSGRLRAIAVSTAKRSRRLSARNSRNGARW